MDTLLNNLSNWWPLLLALASGLGVMYRFLRNSFRSALHEVVLVEIKPMREQFENNGGGSMRDAVDRIETELAVAKEKVLSTNTKVDEANSKVTEAFVVLTALGEDRKKVNADISRQFGSFDDRLEIYVDHIHEVGRKLDLTALRTEDIYKAHENDINSVKKQVEGVQAQMSEMSDTRGHEIGSVSHKLDILTDQMAASQAKINAVTANLKAAYFEFSAEGKLVYFNDSFTELLGMSYREVVKKAEDGSLGSFMHPDDRTKVERAANLALANKTEWISDFRLVRSNGEVVPVIVRAFPIWDGEEFGGYAGAIVAVSSK